MAKKIPYEEMTETEQIKSQLKLLNNLNQRLKNVCDLYYIGWDGNVYLHVLKNCMEKRAFLHQKIENPNHLAPFRGAMIKPQDFFTFYRDLKKAKTVVYIDKSDFDETRQYCINITQEDDLELKYTINIVCSSQEENTGFVHQSYALNQMYKRLFDVLDIFNLETAEVYDLSSSIQDLVAGSSLTVGNEISGEVVDGLSRELFEDMKKADTHMMAYHIPELAKEDRGYFLFENDNDEYHMITIIPYLKGE